MQGSYLLIGGDARQRALAGLLAREHAVLTLGVPGLPDRDGKAVTVVLPIPSAGPDGTPRGIAWEALAARVGPGVRVYGGVFGPLAERLRELGAEPVDLLADPETAAQNARLTAEAALLLVQTERGESLCGRRCAVVGFGRIGQCLARLLAAHGAAVTLLSETEEKRALARALGYAALPPEEARAADPAFLFNTAPARLLPERTLEALSPALLWVELASAPGGLPGTPQRFPVLPAGGLPGKLLPVSAAEALYRGILAKR